MRGTNRSIAGFPYEVFTVRQALAADRNARGPVDQYRPRDVSLRSDLAICHRVPARTTIRRIEIHEGAVGRLGQRCEQSIRRFREAGRLREDGLRDVQGDVTVSR